VCSWDIVHDQTEDGSRLRIFTLIDEYTPQCLALHVARLIRAMDVVKVVKAAIMGLNSSSVPCRTGWRDEGSKRCTLRPEFPGKMGR
jgi:hypothetical protein